MYQVWVWDAQEDGWSKVSGDIATWAEALNFARNRALKDMPWNVEIHEQDEDGETIERVLLEEFDIKRGGINNVIRCPECSVEFDYDEEIHQGRCPECSYLIYEGKVLWKQNDPNAVTNSLCRKSLLKSKKSGSVSSEAK